MKISSDARRIIGVRKDVMQARDSKDVLGPTTGTRTNEETKTVIGRSEYQPQHSYPETVDTGNPYVTRADQNIGC